MIKKEGRRETEVGGESEEGGRGEVGGGGRKERRAK